MLNYTFIQNVKVITGAGCVAQIGELLNTLGYRKTFLVFDQGMRKAGIIDIVETSLRMANIDFVEFDKVQAEPPSEIIESGAALCRELECDSVVAIGGGSSIDTGKGINILRFNEGSILDYATKQMKKCSGLVTIPTTSGTGSELSNGAIISDTKNNLKVPILCLNNMPEYTILDPELTIRLPYDLTLVTGLDVFSHAAESYTSKNANPMTDLICEKIMQTVIETLPVTLREPDNLVAREKMQCAASMGGWMLYSASAHVGHSIAHVLGAHLHITHGAACAYTLPVILKTTAPILPEKIRYIGTLLGANYQGVEQAEEIGQRTSEVYKDFCEKLSLRPMSKYIVQEEEMEALIERIIHEPLAAVAPMEIDKLLVRKMLNEILSS